jgi:uncharacterized membrane protein
VAVSAISSHEVRIAAAVFAATMVALGVAGLIQHDFAAIWQPVPKRWPGREALVWLSGGVALVCGLGLPWRRTAAPAAGVLTVVLLAWLLVFKVRVAIGMPAVAAAWESSGETAVIAAGAWTLFAEAAAGWRPIGFLAGDSGLRAARFLYALAMLAFGAAHIAYIKDTASLIPGWLPAHGAWVWVTAIAYIVAGLAILVGAWARLAATLSAAQMGVFTLLVWAPAIAAPGVGADAWSEAVISWTLTVAGAVVATSYGRTPWLALRQRRHAAASSP